MTWELWTVAHMLVSTRGHDAEAHARAKLAEAHDLGDEAGQIVWSGVLTQLKRLTVKLTPDSQQE
jgi:hypothetical protein